MKQETYIKQKNRPSITLTGFLSVKKATFLARERGLTDRLEILHLVVINKEVLIYTLWIVSAQDKIVMSLHPYHRVSTNNPQ